MKSSNSFIVQFTGLKEGIHDFEFNIGSTFFDENDFWIEMTGNLVLKFQLDKRANMLVMNFDIKGTVTIPCDRCTAPLDKKIKIDQVLYVKFGDEQFAETDDIVIIPENEHEIDLTPYIFEFINLALPMKNVHKEGECDEEMIKSIEKYNRGSKDDNNDDIDPRWEILKGIKNN